MTVKREIEELKKEFEELIELFMRCYSQNDCDNLYTKIELFKNNLEIVYRNLISI